MFCMVVGRGVTGIFLKILLCGEAVNTNRDLALQLRIRSVGSLMVRLAALSQSTGTGHNSILS